MTFELQNILISIFCWLCAGAFLFFMVFGWKLWNLYTRLAWILISNAAIAIGFSFIENTPVLENATTIIHNYVFFSTAGLSIVFGVSIYSIVKKYGKRGELSLEEYMGPVLMAAGLAAHIGKNVSKKTIYKMFNKDETPLIEYSVLKKSPKGEDIWLSENGAIFSRFVHSFLGLLFRTTMKPLSNFMKHRHDCWEIVFVRGGKIYCEIREKWFSEGDVFAYQPYKIHEPKTNEFGATLDVYLLPDNWLVHRLFAWLYLRKFSLKSAL